jgi:hypothetical protein
MSVDIVCDKCGYTVDGSFYCEACRDKYHEEQCNNGCERVGPDDYGYCPDCGRSDCNECENPSKEDYGEQVERGDNYSSYADYLRDTLEARGIDSLSFDDFLNGEPTNVPADTSSSREVDEEADELERKLNEAAEKRKAASNFSGK